MHPILARQLKKYLDGTDPASLPDNIQALLAAISDTYVHADEDRDLAERSLEISTKEMSTINALFTVALESTIDGSLVVDEKGKIALFNPRFLEMWKIPEEVIAARDDDRALAFVLNQLVEPDRFLAKVKELYASPNAESFDVLHLKDGRVFERYSKPQNIGGKSVGRAWSFRDVTERVATERALRERTEELEKLVKTMVGREQRMAELKEQIKKFDTENENGKT